jgi:hypothetical protein
VETSKLGFSLRPVRAVTRYYLRLIPVGLSLSHDLSRSGKRILDTNPKSPPQSQIGGIQMTNSSKAAAGQQKIIDAIKALIAEIETDLVALRRRLKLGEKELRAIG